MTTIAITGIGGFIGLRMAERALEKGWTVKGFDIDADGVARAQAAGADAIKGDVCDPDFLEDFFRDVHVVFHTAAVVDETGSRDFFYKINVEGTRAVCASADIAGVTRLVHLSSVMVYGFDYPDGVDETHELTEQNNIYCETKQVSDQVARGFHQPGGLEVIVIRPGDVYGAGSRPWMLRPLQTMKAGLFTLPAKGSGLVNHVYVDNLLDAVFLALEKDATGECFNITDGIATTCADFFRYHADMLGKKRIPTAPAMVLKSFLTLAAPAWRLFGSEPPATSEALDFLLRTSKISGEKARRELGYEPAIDLEEGMRRVAMELRDSGRIDPRLVGDQNEQ